MDGLDRRSEDRMNVLGFDTTSRRVSIAVLRDKELLAEHRFSSHDDLSAVMIPGVEFLLRSLHMTVSGIDLFGAAVGPGLFTGIRIGLAALKGLNFAAGRPVIGVNTLEALADAACADAGPERTVVPMIDARKGEVYMAAYGFENGEPRERLAPSLLRVEDAVPFLAPFGDLLFVGGGAENHADSVRRFFPGGRIVRGSDFLAVEIARIALRRFGEGRCPTDLQPLRPCYIRKPDAETRSDPSVRADD